MKTLSATQWIACAMCTLAGCAIPPRTQPSAFEAIDAELRQAAENRPAPKPVEQNVLRSLLPPIVADLPAPGPQPEETFDLKVSNVPAPAVLNALVNDTRFSMIVHPSIKDPISLTLKQVTLREALNSVREIYGYEYRIEGNLVYVLPAGLQTRLFKVDYLAAQRTGTTDIRVSSNSVGDGTTAPGVSQSTSMQTISTNNFWAELRGTLAVLAGCTATQTAAGGTGAGAGAAGGATGGAATGALNNPMARAALRAEQQLYGPLYCPEGRTLVVSPQSGTVLVRAMPEELKNITSYLKASQNAVERQVLIEAKIVEVALRDGYETGINWATFFRSSSIAAAQLTPGTSIGPSGSGPLTGGLPPSGISTPLTATLGSAARAVSAGISAGGSLFGVAIQAGNFAALLSFLETQGVVHTLSSPRIATMNNQKAVLKIGSDSLFVTKITGGSVTPTVAGGAPTISSPTFDVQSFFSGISLDVTPQIGEDGNILLHVRPSVSDVAQRLSAFNLGALGTFTIPLVSNSISETDSLIRAQDSQIVAIGGLMRTVQTENRNGVPGLGSEQSAFGALFRNVAQASEKRELVILLKPTIVQADSTWQRDILDVRERPQGMNRGFSLGGRADVFGTGTEGARR